MHVASDSNDSLSTDPRYRTAELNPEFNVAAASQLASR